VPGPVTFQLFERGFDSRIALWLAAVLIGTGIPGLLGRLPGSRPAPTSSASRGRPNPLYRRICYTVAWSELIAYTSINLAGLAGAVATGRWQLRQIYDAAYFPIVVTVWILGALGGCARQTVNQGRRRRTALLLWHRLGGDGRAPRVVAPVAHAARGFAPDLAKLAVFAGILTFMGLLARRGLLPRTRRIVQGNGPYPTERFPAPGRLVDVAGVRVPPS